MDEGILNDLLECSVCLERLNSSSKVLPCQHTFCRECLESIYNKHKELKCPECRILVPIRIEDLPPNILLMRILEGIKSTAPRKDKQNVNVSVALKDRIGQENPNSKSTTENTELPDAAGLIDSHNQAYYFLAKAVYDYIPKESSGLELKRGDLINVKKQVDINWFYGECNGKEGLFPANYVLAVAPLPSSIPQCKALYDFHMETDEEGCLSFNKGEIIVVIRRVDQNWAEGRLQNKIGIFPLAFVELNSLARSLINLSTKIYSSNQQQSPTVSAPQISNHRKLHEEKKRHKNEFLDSPRPQDQQLFKKVDNPNFNIFATSFLPSNYIALFSYKPQKVDELELKKGETYIVTERCQDGWYKGVSKNTQKSGVFPGNYVTLLTETVKSPHLMNLEDKKNKSKYTNNTKQFSIEQSTHGVPPELPPRCSSPAVNINSCIFIETSQTNSCDSTNSVKAPTTAADVINVGKSDDKNGERLDKGSSNFIRRLTTTKRSKSPPATLLSIDNPGFEDNAASGIVLSSTHVRSGSCPSQMSQISTPNQSHNRNAGLMMISQRLKHREQLSVPIDLPRCEDKDNKRRLNSKNYHRKSNSLDIENDTRPAQCKGYRYRCIAPYPPNTEYELELQVNDIVYVLKKRDDGWYKGTQQRTGRTGLFPASFVEKF